MLSDLCNKSHSQSSKENDHFLQYSRMLTSGFCFRFGLNEILVVLLIAGVRLLVQTQYLVDKKEALEGKALYGYAFRNLTVTRTVECFYSCLKDCFCMAFQMCNNTECQLLSSNRFQNPSSMGDLPRCTYYNLLPIQSKQAHENTFVC